MLGQAFVTLAGFIPTSAAFDESLAMKISSHLAASTPVQSRPGSRSASANAAPVSESSRPLPQPPQAVASRSGLDNPLKAERVTSSAAETVRAQHIQPTPQVPPPAEIRRPDLSLGTHNASPGTQAYAAMAASSENSRKGSKVNTKA